MERFGVGFVGVIFFGWIGSLFGDTGTIIGIIFGIMSGFSHEPEKAKNIKKKSVSISSENQSCHCGSGKRYKNCHGLKKEIAKAKNDRLYVDVVTELMAACITADAVIEESEIDLATLLIESDDLIFDKKIALENLKINIDDFHKEREKSKAVFKLKMTSVIHKVKEIGSSLKKERILVILDGLLDSIRDGNRKESEEFVEKVRQILSVSTEFDSKQSAAEHYILNSGNAEAVNSLREMQKNPNTYKEKFKQASKGNRVMKTALGVFTGVIAANLVTSAFHQYQLDEALSNFDSELESMGGIDNLQMDQESHIHFADLGAASEEAQYSEDMQLADAGYIEVDEGIEMDNDMGFDGGDDFDFF